MNAKKIRSGLVVLFALLLVPFASSPISLADDQDGSFFDLELNPFLFEILFTDVDTNSSKFEEYRDMESDALIRKLRLFGELGDPNRTFGFDIENASRADERYTMYYQSSGRYSLMLDYNVIPHRFGNDGRMLHSLASGPDDLTISDTTQQTLQDAVETQLGGGGSIGFDFLRDQLQPFIDTATLVDPGLDRRRARLTFDIGKMKRLAWKVDIQQETREGSRPYGATFGFSNAIELPEPIKYDTRSAEISGEWKAHRGGLRFGLNISSFENKIDTLTYDNPWRLVDSTDSNAYSSPGTRSIGGPSAGRNALSPDNQAGRVFAAGHAKLGQKGWLNANLSLGRMEQDEPLLPYTINTAINEFSASAPAPFQASDPANLPVRNADTKVDVLHFTANAGTRIGKKGSVKFRARYYDYDNQSPMIEMPGYVRMDAVWEDIPRVTIPYSYTRQKVGVEFGFDPTPKTHLALGYDLKSWDRDFREIDKSDEDIIHFTVDTRAFKNVTLRGGWEYGNRTTDDYDVEAQLVTFLDPDEEINNQPGLRKYDEAERTYNEGRFSAFILAGDAVTITVGTTFRDEDYDESEFGLQSEEIMQYNAEVSYMPHERFSFFVFGHRADRETFQRARQSGGLLSTSPLDDWELQLTEVTNTFGLGLNSRFGDRWTLDVTGSWSDSDGESDFFSPPGGTPDGATGFDEYDDNEWIVYSARLGFKASEHIRAGIKFQHDEFETNRFSRDGVAPYLPGALILDFNDGDYSADLLMVDMTVLF